MTRLKIKENIFAKGFQADIESAKKCKSHNSAESPEKPRRSSMNNLIQRSVSG